MPYKHREPVPENQMDRIRFEGRESICQTLRDMYHLTENEDIRLKCRLAMAMAKAMANKLQAYRDQQPVEIYSEYEDGI